MSLRALVLAAVLAAGVAAPSARADKGLKRVGVQAGFAGLANEGSFAGFGGGLTGAYGLTDAWTLRVDATASSNQASDKGGRSLVLGQSIGVQYALDVIEIVPFFGAHVGAFELLGGGLSKREIKPAISLSFGVDWILSRTFTVGVDLRAHALPADFVGSPSNPTPFYATTMAKCEFTWGWF